METVAEKVCSACGELKPPDAFGVKTRENGKQALEARCYACAAEAARARRMVLTAEQREQVNAANRERYASRPLASRRESWRKASRHRTFRASPPNTATIRRMEQLMRRTGGHPVIVTLDISGQFDRELFDRMITNVGVNWGDLAIQCHQYVVQCLRRRFTNNPGRKDDAMDSLFMYALSLLGNDVRWFREVDAEKPSAKFCRYVGAAAKRLAIKMSVEKALPLDGNGQIEAPENN